MKKNIVIFINDVKEKIAQSLLFNSACTHFHLVRRYMIEILPIRRKTPVNLSTSKAPTVLFFDVKVHMYNIVGILIVIQ